MSSDYLSISLVSKHLCKKRQANNNLVCCTYADICKAQFTNNFFFSINSLSVIAPSCICFIICCYKNMLFFKVFRLNLLAFIKWITVNILTIFLKQILFSFSFFSDINMYDLSVRFDTNSYVVLTTCGAFNPGFIMRRKAGILSVLSSTMSLHVELHLLSCLTFCSLDQLFLLCILFNCITSSNFWSNFTHLSFMRFSTCTCPLNI